MATTVKRCECPESRWRNCKHNWVVRYRDQAGKQRERSFPHDKKTIAGNWATEVEHKKTIGELIDPKAADVKFREAAEEWVKKRKTPSTRDKYGRMLDKHIYPVFAGTTLKRLANSRDEVEEFLTETMPDHDMGASATRTAYIIIKGVVGEYVRMGKLPRHNLTGIELDPAPIKADVPFVTRKQLDSLTETMPEAYRSIVWLMRGCGLRISEALAASKPNLRKTKSGWILRLTEQQRDTQDYGPLKHRKDGEYRDVPCPSNVARIILDAEALDGDGHIYPMTHRSVIARQFKKWCEANSVAGLTPHGLRHVFASNCLSNGIPISDVSKWLGHKDINTTFAIYGHLTPDSWERAAKALDAEYDTWSQAA